MDDGEGEMMKRSIFRLVLATTMFCLGIGGAQARPAHYPPCGDHQPPNQPSAFCRPAFIGGTLVGLRSSMPFAWIRSAPDSHASALATIWPDDNPTLKIMAGDNVYSSAHWDGLQWWWQVATLAEHPTVRGWVEQAALRAIGPTDSSPYVLADWQPPLTVRAEDGLPFLWLRSAPASDASVVTVIPSRGHVTILGDPQYDSIQWWWRVAYRTGYGTKIGYVEQSLVEPV